MWEWIAQILQYNRKISSLQHTHVNMKEQDRREQESARATPYDYESKSDKRNLRTSHYGSKQVVDNDDKVDCNDLRPDLPIDLTTLVKLYYSFNLTSGTSHEPDS